MFVKGIFFFFFFFFFFLQSVDVKWDGSEKIIFLIMLSDFIAYDFQRINHSTTFKIPSLQGSVSVTVNLLRAHVQDQQPTSLF